MIADGLARTGARVLVSTATDATLAIGNHPAITRRCGRLDLAAMIALCRTHDVRLIVDATHPYAAEVRATARQSAAELSLPYLTFIRPATISSHAEGVFLAADHEQASRLAFSFGRPVLLTTGSRNLRPYTAQAATTGTPLYVRVLDAAESLDACRAAGVAAGNIISGRGPFTVEENRQHIRRTGAGVLVTKDSGAAGGAAEKLDAARLENCRVVVVGRPPTAGDSFDSIDSLLAKVKTILR